jgi:hypothetical protein
MNKHSAPRASSIHRPALPLLLYDLTAATQFLPPAAVLPEQFYGSPSGAYSGRGEVALMRAVLEDAVNCFQRALGPNADRMAKDAEKWLFNDDARWPFSFVNICTVLGLNAEYVRLGLKRWRQNPLVLPARKRRREALGRRPATIAA